MKKLLKKTKCPNCGNRIIIGRPNENLKFQTPKDCATCRSLGKEKAIAQRLNLHKKSRGVYR